MRKSDVICPKCKVGYLAQDEHALNVAALRKQKDRPQAVSL
jgi:hypothetical protein